MYQCAEYNILYYVQCVARGWRGGFAAGRPRHIIHNIIIYVFRKEQKCSYYTTPPTERSAFGFCPKRVTRKTSMGYIYFIPTIRACIIRIIYTINYVYKPSRNETRIYGGCSLDGVKKKKKKNTNLWSRNAARIRRVIARCSRSVIYDACDVTGRSKIAPYSTPPPIVGQCLGGGEVVRCVEG